METKKTFSTRQAINKKQLAIKLSKLRLLSKLDVNLEQYQTEGNFAAELLFLAYQNGDIKNKIVADFGCGNGILGIGALLLGAKFVYFLDSDKDALEVCEGNINSFGLRNFKIINSDVSEFNVKVDTVIMNPPFGVQNRKADKQFLEASMRHANKIYSVHKIESKNFIEQISKENGFNVLDVLEREFFIGKTLKFHRRRRHSFKVGIWVLGKNVI